MALALVKPCRDALDRIAKTAFGTLVGDNNAAPAGVPVMAAQKDGRDMMVKRLFSGSALALTCAALLGFAPAYAQAVSGTAPVASVPSSTSSTQAPLAVQPASSGSAPSSIASTSQPLAATATNSATTQSGVATADQAASINADLKSGKTATVTGVGTLPAANDTPPVDPSDPLASFRNAQAADTKPANPAVEAPLPTPGGFQQPVSGTTPTTTPTDQSLNIDSLVDVEAKQAELQLKARDQAFDAALNGMMPLSPEQIRALLDKYKVTRQESETRIGGTPTPEITTQTVSLEPGVAPPVIKLSPGHVTSVTMLDITGEPWPVQDVSWGGNFEVISPGDGGHIIRISPMAATEVGNMSVQLIGLKTPVTFTLETQLDVVQYRFDARIPENGPNAHPPIIEPGLDIEAGSDKALTKILDGVPPAGTSKLKLSGVDARTAVFRIGDVSYLRTPLTLLSPGWTASVKSADGMTVYTVNNTPVFLLSDRGKMVRAMVEDKP